MRALLRALALLSIIAFVGSAASAEAPVDRVIVRWKAEAAGDAPREAAVNDVQQRIGRPLARMRAIGSRMEVLHLPADGVDGATVLRELRRDPRVEFAVADRRVHVHAVPSDPLFAEQWYLAGTEVAATRATAAWNVTLGGTPLASSMVVAVIDTGVRFEHPDLQRAAAGGKLLPGYDFVSGDKPGVFSTANDGDGWDADPSDPGDYLTAADLQSDLYKGKKCGGGTDQEQPTVSSWHGTRVAGLVAAMSDNGVGITGAAYHVRVLPVRALGKCGGYDSDVLAAMYWAAGLTIPTPLLSGTPPANTNPARILNMSLGSVGACSAAYKQAVDDITAAGVLIVASAGNEGGPVDSPANCGGVLAVAGLRHAGTKVGYSNLGPEVTLAAPAGNCGNLAGVCTYQLITTTNDGQQSPGGSTYTSSNTATINTANVGTSFSAPLASAGAALMLSVNARLTPPKVIERLRATTRPFPTQSDNTTQPPTCHVPASSTDLQDSECICTTGTCGAGMLDIGAAVAAAQRPAAIATVTGTVGVGRTLTLDGSQSAAAAGRAIATWTWSTVSTSGGAATPSFATPSSSTTALVSPTAGSMTVRLTIVDDHGSSDSADVTIDAASAGSTVTATSAPPAAPASTSGGGGAVDLPWLLLAVLAMTARQLKSRSGSDRARA